MLEKVKEAELRLEELDRELSAPEILSNQEMLLSLLKERKEIEPIVQKYKEYCKAESDLAEADRVIKDAEGDPELQQMAEEESRACRATLERCLAELRLLLIPHDANDDKNVILEIRAGAGGEEAALFAADLYRMYYMYAVSRGWQLELLSQNPTELGGFREISFLVAGTAAYAHLKYESGVHRVQRVPRTESQGRIQTSTVTVAVLPEAEEIDIRIDPSDLQVETLKSSGAGGQHVNKTESAIRILHKPSGIVVFCQEERSQFKNRDKAMRMLRTRLYERETEKQQGEIMRTRRSQVGTGDRSEKIRTYNYPQSRVTDHRIGLTLYQLTSFLNGNIGPMIDALRLADHESAWKGQQNGEN